MVGLKIIFIKRIYQKKVSSGDMRFTTAETDLKGAGTKYLSTIPIFGFRKKCERGNRY